MPQVAAASVRDLPSITNASANIRRAALASPVRLAARRNCAGVCSVRVIATAVIPASSRIKEARESRPNQTGNPLRVSHIRRWYKADLLASPNGERQAVDDPHRVGARCALDAAIVEADRLETDFATRYRQGLGPWA